MFSSHLSQLCFIVLCLVRLCFFFLSLFLKLSAHPSTPFIPSLIPPFVSKNRWLTGRFRELYRLVGGLMSPGCGRARVNHQWDSAQWCELRLEQVLQVFLRATNPVISLWTCEYTEQGDWDRNTSAPFLRSTGLCLVFHWHKKITQTLDAFEHYLCCHGQSWMLKPL